MKRKASTVENTVLLVDDDERILFGLSRALRQQPYKLYTARSGEEAMMALKTHDVDVIVVDDKMPGISGTDLLSWVAKHYVGVMRIMLTGHANISNAIRAINEGAVYQFLTKPCDELQLAVAIRKALEHSGQSKANLRVIEDTKRQSKALEQFNRELEILMRIVCKDLQAPLKNILSSFQSIEEQYQDILDPKARRLADDALNAAAEAQRLIAKLLNHFRVEGPGIVSDISPAEQDKKTPVFADAEQ